MSLTLLLVSGILLFLFTLIGVWLGRKMGSAEVATTLAERQQAAEDAQREIQTRLVLANQAALTKVEERDEQLKELRQERDALRGHLWRRSGATSSP